MDIKNIFDFESKVDFLLNTYNTEPSIKEQSQYMSSNIINENFTQIETYLNNMYEKIRVLDEVIDYAKIYVSNEIDATISDCKEILSNIEHLNNMIFNDTKNYTIINVPIDINSSLTMTDRDGSALKSCNIYNGSLSLSGTIKNTIPVKSISVKSSEQVYESNINSLLNNESYRTFYLLDAVSKNGIEEVITFQFNQPKEINNISLKLSNANLKNIIYVHEDGTETTDAEMLRGIIPKLKILKVKLTIVCSNYVAKSIKITTTEENKFDSLNKEWQSIYNSIVNQDNDFAKTEYKTKIQDYLEGIYLKGVNNG